MLGVKVTKPVALGLCSVTLIGTGGAEVRDILEKLRKETSIPRRRRPDRRLRGVRSGERRIRGHGRPVADHAGPQPPYRGGAITDADEVG
jgi:hypothetical protein